MKGYQKRIEAQESDAQCLGPRQGRKGFTLLEIIVVVSITVILAALTLTVMSRTRRAADRSRCEVQLQSIALALDAYRQEQGHFPEDLQELEDDKYVQEKSIMHCPDDPDPLGTYAPFYVMRDRFSKSDLPLLVCPFHEGDGQGNQSYVGRYTTQLMTKPAVLTASRATTVQHPGKKPVAAPVGLVLHGADRITTSNNGGATVTFADGSSATLKKNTTLTLLQSFVEKGSQPVIYTLLRQTIGDVSYEVHTGSKFDVTTPSATAGALGTKFKISIDSGYNTTLLVTQGKVHFVNEKKAMPVTNGVPVTAQNHNPHFR